jgi:Fe-S-cluster containining protein
MAALVADDRFADYRRLLDKATAKFEEIRARRPRDFRCGRGCASCCAPGLSVFQVERESIRAHILSAPGLGTRLAALEAANQRRGGRCAFLEEGLSCAIYEARPLICRTHGAPVFFRDRGDGESDGGVGGESFAIDACPLNFVEGEGLAGIASDGAINLDLLNDLLVLVDRRFSAESGSVPGERVALAPSAILAP